MSFTGNEGEQITLQEGGVYTERYRSANPTAIKGVFFGRNHIQKILDQTDCKGLRFYFANTETGNPTLVMVGADSAQNDLLNVIVEKALSCPTFCGSINALNDNAAQGESR